ncbi:hypothetical protein BDR03DRAFT_1014946 [Suillus americanus]|nr:hypothetical protein BDR03DRAFT_1014946 [Suillus americanus]
MDGIDEDDTHSNTISLNSPPRPKTTGKGKKHQDPPSPSSPPSPSPPATFAMPQKPRTSAQDDRSMFKSHAGQVMMREKSKGGGSVASSRSHTLLACSKPTSSSQSSSPTAQTSLLTKPVSAVSKHLRMEVCEQVDLINNDLESMHSEKLSLYQLKNEWLMVKLNASRQEKEHNLLREEHANECADAAVVHQHFKEHKETEICLQEADTAALALEADVLRLQIDLSQWNYAPPPPSARTDSSASSPVFNYPPLPTGAESQGGRGSYAPSFGGAYAPTTQSFNSGPYSPAAPSFSNGFSYHGHNDDNPLAEEMEDLHMDGIDEDDTHGNTISLNSPPRPKTTGKGKKRQDPPSPSSPPSPPSPSPPATFAMPQKPAPLPRMIALRSSSTLARSHTLSARSKPTSSSQSSSPTAQTSLLTKPASAVSKHLRMEVCKQVDLINNDLESMHSEKLSLYQLKNEWLMAKLNASRQEKEHNLLREEHTNERADAAAVHQHFKEHKETEIHLQEADTAALALEADVLRLQIEWAKLNNKPA